MDTQPILIELPVIPVEPEPSRDPAAIAFSRRLAMLRGEVEPPDSDIPLCVYCGESSGRLIESDAVGDFIHEECWPAFREHPEVKAMQAQAAAETEAKEENYSLWVREGRVLGARRKSLIDGFSDLQFQIGDWLIEGEDGGFKVQKGLYKVAEELTGYKTKSLRDFAYVARRVPPSIRIDKPWATHQAVASLKTEALRKQALDRAIEKGWKVRDVRKALAKVKPEYKDLTPRTAKEHAVDDSDAIVSSRFRTWMKSLSPPESDFTFLLPRMTAEGRKRISEDLKKTATKLLEYAARLEEEQLAEQAEVAAAAVRQEP
jgi:hypothetical protein